MEKRRQAPVLSILAIVLGLHLGAVWLLLAPRLFPVGTKSSSLEYVWVAPPPTVAASDYKSTGHAARKDAARQRAADRAPESPSNAPRLDVEINAAHPTPDWTEELGRVARNTVTNDAAEQRHKFDFAHSFPTPRKHAPEFDWDYAATHRIEAIPEGGLLVHLSDNCVFILFPLPLVGCGIGKRPVNGDLFKHLHDDE
jgi:hypothetical protein